MAESNDERTIEQLERQERWVDQQTSKETLERLVALINTPEAEAWLANHLDVAAPFMQGIMGRIHAGDSLSLMEQLVDVDDGFADALARAHDTEGKPDPAGVRITIERLIILLRAAFIERLFGPDRRELLERALQESGYLASSEATTQ